MDINKTGKRWFYLVLGTVSLLFAGIIYAWSILKAPLAEEFGWTASQLSLNYTLTMSFFCLGCILCGLMVKKIGFKLSLIISAVLSTLGFFLTGCTKGNVAVLFLSYGVLSGLGIGIAYNAVISTVGAWFPDKKGLCSGILMMGFGASALILGSLADALIATPTFGWRLTFQTLGLALGIVLLTAGLLLKRPEVEQVPATAAGSSGSVRDVNTAEMLRSGSFWMAFFCLSFLSAVGNTVISTAKDISLSVGTSAVLSTMLVGLLSVCNGLGRMITGALFDRAGRNHHDDCQPGDHRRCADYAFCGGNFLPGAVCCRHVPDGPFLWRMSHHRFCLDLRDVRNQVFLHELPHHDMHADVSFLYCHRN